MTNIKGFLISDIFVSQDSSQLNVLISSLPFENTLEAIAFYADTNDSVTNVMSFDRSNAENSIGARSTLSWPTVHFLYSTFSEILKPGYHI